MRRLRGSSWLCWCAWCLVVGVLFNSCASHRSSERFADTVSREGIRPSLSLALWAIRAAHSDDGDTNRYLAYANALLGRPYQAYFVRPMERWKLDSRQFANGKDQADPQETPPVAPSSGLIPYRDFSVEYPPGFFLFSVPCALITGDLDWFRAIFSLFMGGLLTLGLVISRRLAAELAPDRQASLVPWATGMALALGTILVRRYDPVVSFAYCLILWGAIGRKPWVAGVGFGLGIAAKLLPILLVPLALVFWFAMNRRREALVALATAVGVGIVIGLPAVAAAGTSMLDLFAYHGHRPLQIESSGGAMLIVSRFFAPDSAAFADTFGSANVVASWDGPFRWLSGILPFASLAAICAWAWRSLRSAQEPRATAWVLLRATCAILVAWMTLGKVFSPQYVTWLMPLGVLAAVVDPRASSRWGLLAALVLTQIIYPFAYRVQFANSLSPWFGTIVLVRNGLLLVWAARLLGNGAVLPPRPSPSRIPSCEAS